MSIQRCISISHTPHLRAQKQCKVGLFSTSGLIPNCAITIIITLHFGKMLFPIPSTAHIGESRHQMSAHHWATVASSNLSHIQPTIVLLPEQGLRQHWPTSSSSSSAPWAQCLPLSPAHCTTYRHLAVSVSCSLNDNDDDVSNVPYYHILKKLNKELVTDVACCRKRWKKQANIPCEQVYHRHDWQDQ